MKIGKKFYFLEGFLKNLFSKKEFPWKNSKAWIKYGMDGMDWMEWVKKAMEMALEPGKHEF